MMIVLSPAKTLDFDSPAPLPDHSEAQMLPDAQRLVGRLKAMEPRELGKLMSISDKLADLNATRFKLWRRPFTTPEAKQAVLAFAGDVYEGLEAGRLAPDQLRWAQDHLRILSGLYGVLRPLDLIRPYRLEMGTRLPNERGDDLYEFWGPRIARALKKDVQAHPDPTLVNLASDEYFRAVDRKALGLRVVQPVFQEARDDPARPWAVIGLFAKRARGRMARFAIERRIERATDLQAFVADGYRFAPEASNDERWVFRRRAR